MLQISTGKFFDDENMRKHDDKFVFYSNVILPINLETVSPLISVEQVESGSVSCYVVSYQLITEVDPIIVKCGNQDFIAQFILAWAFYFDCVAKTQKELVQKICREKKVSTYDQAAAAEISPKTVELGKRISLEEMNAFKCFLDSLMNVNRSCYKSTIAAIKIIDDAKETLSMNFDLGYSTLVYALESLSQKHDGYVPEWNHYDDSIRRKIEPIFNEMEEGHSNSIKESLIEGKQFKLRKRFESFINNNLDEQFFKEYLGENAKTLRRSYLQRCLLNLYQLRSSFVHELKPLDVMLSSPHSPLSDYIVRFGEPYFTFTGINRLARAVIINFLNKNSTNDVETIFWTRETSSVVIAEMCASTWIHNPQSFNENKINKWFTEYINMLNRKNVVEQQKIMNKIKEDFDRYKKPFRSPAIHYYWLYNANHNHSESSWQKFMEKHHIYTGNSFHFFVVIVYLYRKLSFLNNEGEVPADLDDFDTAYSEYNKKRFHKSGLSLSAFTEAALLCAAANNALEKRDLSRFSKYLSLAIEESASNLENSKLISQALKNQEEVDINKYFDVQQSV
ncbi:hypothetical protein [Ferrimonas lipolytica]|uniref:Apea-like HEPN domain-containing protein n=1 Tax=Ferrimonas lipolytica TaxID=2724191 RepID=A0A6H1UKJ1_9GAMM|nr:hypothetical protein [Ferrimonas lipolytica]QIZ78746.1 hypothetical protein HER31_18665 [Ferrimonas lipolytica]